MLSFARLVLAVGGTAMLIGGLALAALGLFAGPWLRSLLPPVVIDAQAVGGAAFALGVFFALAGAAQIVAAASIARGGRWVAASAAVIAALLASLLAACAVAAATEAARGGSLWFLAGSLALMAAALSYGGGAWGLARASAQSPGLPS